MIPADPFVEASARELLARHLASEMALRLGVDGLAPGERQVAEAVAAFWISRHPDRGLSAGYIDLLVARALCAAGRQDSAGRWLGRDAAGDGVADPVIAALSADDVSPHVMATLSSRLVRPGQLHCSGAGFAWTLDCGHLVLGQAAGLEMLCHAVIRSLLRGVAPLWDAAGGRGSLGVKGGADLARRVLGEGAPQRKREAFREDLEVLCEASLAAAQRERGWPVVPSVVRLD